MSRCPIRQRIVNCLILRECCSFVPFPCKSWLVRRCSCRGNYLLECFTLGWEQFCLCLFAESRGLRTEACRLCIVLFGAGSGGIAIQTCGNVGRAAEGTIEYQRLRVARFGQGIVLLKARQVTKHGEGDGDIPGDPDGGLSPFCGSVPDLQIGRSCLLGEEPAQMSLALWSLQKGFQESSTVKVAKNVDFIEWPLQ